MASKVEKLQEQVDDARRRRSAEVSRLQAELSAEVAKAKSKKGTKNEKPSAPANDS